MLSHLPAAPKPVNHEFVVSVVLAVQSREPRLLPAIRTFRTTVAPGTQLSMLTSARGFKHKKTREKLGTCKGEDQIFGSEEEELNRCQTSPQEAIAAAQLRGRLKNAATSASSICPWQDALQLLASSSLLEHVASNCRASCQGQMLLAC